MVEGLRRRLDEVGVRSTIEWYPGVTHGFAFPQRDSYDEAAAERHHERVLDLFARTLGR
jgi:dienelactone hydrolase